MKITHNKVGQNLNTKDTGKTDKSDKAGAAALGGQKGNSAALSEADLGATKVDLSPRAQDMKKIKEAAMAAPEIREDKVAALQKMVDEGKYKVSAKDIADKMVDEELQWS
jgi:negative regulator of flagellin synthesis FlgM